MAYSLPGCADDREATANDVVFLFESAKVGSKTWRLPEPAQGYVDQILKSYAEWNASHAPIEAMNGADALWSIDSPKWQSSKEINEALLKYTEFRKTKNAEDRGKFTDDLRKAINEVPEIPGREDLAERVVRTIWDGESAVPSQRQVEDYPVAQAIEVLLNDVQKHMDKLDNSKTGLYFTDAQVQSGIHEQYNAIKAQITEMQATEKATWQAFLAEQSAHAAELAPKVKQLGETMSDRADLEYRRQKLRLEYHEEAVRLAEKKIEALEEVLSKQDKPEPAGDAKDE